MASERTTITLDGGATIGSELARKRRMTTDGSTWVLYLKDDATFQLRGLKTATRRPDCISNLVYGDGYGRRRPEDDKGAVLDQDHESEKRQTEADLQRRMPSRKGRSPRRNDCRRRKKAADGPKTPRRSEGRRPRRAPGLKDDSDDGDDDGAVPPPPEDATSRRNELVTRSACSRR